MWFSAPGVNRVGRIEPSVNTDEAPPTVTIVSPANGAVLTKGEGMLADYWCADDPAPAWRRARAPSRTAPSCPTASGHVFTVTGEDNQGNTASATHRYVVFGISGPITNQSVFGAGRTLPIILDLGSRPQGPTFADGTRRSGASTARAASRSAPTRPPTSSPSTRTVACSSCGRNGSWAGTCQSLVVRLGFTGWTGADAIFTVRFA